MAIQKLAGNYGVVELNKLAAVRTGEIEAQYELDGTDFATNPAENGMLLKVDHVAKSVKLPSGATDADAFYLHASVEKDYEGKGRKYFAVERGTFLPRLMKLNRGDRFETNAVQYDDVTYADFATLSAAIDATTVYGVPDASGYINIVADVAASTDVEVVVLKAVEGVTLPNGENGIKFVVQQVQ